MWEQTNQINRNWNGLLHSEQERGTQKSIDDGGTQNVCEMKKLW